MRAYHRTWTNIALLLLIGVALAGCGSSRTSSAAAAQHKQSAAPAAAVQVTTMGPNFILTDAAGLTLYYFARDEVGSGVSACNAACVAERPPVTIATSGVVQPVGLPPGVLDTIKRSDGTLQITYAGRPLYHSVADRVPGEAKGQSDAWLLAKVELICDCFHEH